MSYVKIGPMDYLDCRKVSSSVYSVSFSPDNLYYMCLPFVFELEFDGFTHLVSPLYSEFFKNCSLHFLEVFR